MPPDPAPVKSVLKVKGFSSATKVLLPLKLCELDAAEPISVSKPAIPPPSFPRLVNEKPPVWITIGSAFIAGANAVDARRRANPRPALVRHRILIFPAFIEPPKSDFDNQACPSATLRPRLACLNEAVDNGKREER